MQFKTLLTSAMMAASSMGLTLPTVTLPNPLSPVPGYPFGTTCLSDAQANFVAEQFRQILANPDRAKAKTIANTLIGDNYTESSDSINILAGNPLGSASFNSKAQFIAGATGGPASAFSTLKVYHDCTNILWQWNLVGLGSGKYPVKGLNSFTVNAITGVISRTDLEFNSIAWGIDTGLTCNPLPLPLPGSK